MCPRDTSPRVAFGDSLLEILRFGDGVSSPKDHPPALTQAKMLNSQPYMDVYMVFIGCLYGVYMVFTWCLHGVYRVFTWCLHGVFRVFMVEISKYLHHRAPPCGDEELLFAI